MSIETYRDPRNQLVREKYFSIRPKPLERWLWSKGVPPAAERVFWLHWQEGQQRGDWCSEIPLKRVARECQLDLSTITRAYQVLQKMGCIRRTDPGRDPSNPFQQATAVTEVHVPRELLVELNRHPNRRSGPAATGRPASPPVAVVEQPPPASEPEAPSRADPFVGLRGRDRRQALAQLLHGMSQTEEGAYHQALRMRCAHMTFDVDSKLAPEARGQVLQFLALLATPRAAPGPSLPETRREAVGPRKLSAFELARLRRDIQTTTSSAAAPEVLRQVVWSVEEGALQRFKTAHAIHIALKKIREGAWTRPNRMPPNWARAMGVPSRPEACRHA